MLMQTVQQIQSWLVCPSNMKIVRLLRHSWYSSDLRGTGIFRCVSFKFFLQLDCCTKSKSVELNQNANNHVLLNQNIYNSEGFLKIKLRDFTFILFFTLYFFSSTKWLLKAEFISSKKSYSRSYILRFYLLF